MKLKYFLALMPVMIFLSCKNFDEKSSNTQIRYNDSISIGVAPLRVDSIVKLKDNIITTGDSKAYNELASDFLLNGREDDLLYYALIMANKYNNAYACYNIYYILNSNRNGENFLNSDSKTKNMAVYYLLRSKELGYEYCEHDIEEIFGKRSNPKSDDFLDRSRDVVFQIK